MQTIREELVRLAEADFKRFQCRLMPTVDPQRVLGVRMPRLRELAARLTPQQQTAVLSTLPHALYEENNLHACVIGRISDFEECIRQTERFLPYIDNWATCDSLRPRVFARHKAELFEKCFEWMQASHGFTIRFGLEMLMVHGLNEAFDPLFLKRAAQVESEEYYVKMMVAWFFATALTKHWDDTLPYLQNGVPDDWVHSKIIQKARESRCLSAGQKEYLYTLKCARKDDKI